ncbi:hypothetical protein SBADM41S_02708 [Streptomyces badius]
MSASVLYDAPGPKAVVRNRIYAVVGSLAIAALIVVSILRLADKGHLAPEMWDIFNYAGMPAEHRRRGARHPRRRSVSPRSVRWSSACSWRIGRGSRTTSRSAGWRPPSIELFRSRAGC